MYKYCYSNLSAIYAKDLFYATRILKIKLNSMADFRRKTDTPQSWLICFIAFNILIFINGTQYSFGLLMPYLME